MTWVEGRKVYQVLQFARPDSVIFVERMLVCDFCEAGDVFFLGEDLGCGVVEDGFYYARPNV